MNLADQTRSTVDSTATLRRFSVRLLCLLALNLLGTHQHLRSMIAMADLAAVFCGGCAVFSDERFGKGPINQWDEAAAFLGLRCIAALALHAGV